ncbi:MAG TPA: (2Fe-2S) ferredoxin domain-containing protein, partial [Bacillota bacterium]|nr:(2Fe-2S) ferredoxin domain-containing protein [Bacillota bacterium]
MIKSQMELLELQKSWKSGFARETGRILVCAGTGCVANGSLKVYENLLEEVKQRGAYISVQMLLENETSGTTVVKSGCHGFCEMGPLVRVEPAGILYTKVKPEDAAEIVTALLEAKEPVERLLYKHPVSGEHYAEESEIPFYKHQTRNVLSHCGVIDAEDI